jgi:phosphoribosylamine-glycine ligase
VDWTRAPLNLDLLDWISDPRDRHYLDAGQLYKRLAGLDQGRAGGGNGCIVLAHLGSERKADFLDEVLPAALEELAGRGYSFVTVSRMFNGQGE